MGREDELRDATVDAFEESTGNVPNDYEMGTINALVRDYVDESDQGKSK